jgi:hypothetical protein
LVDEVVVEFGATVDRYGGFFRTHGRDNAAVARRYPHGLALAEDRAFKSMAAVVEHGRAQQFQHCISDSPWDHEPVVAQISADADRSLGGQPGSCLIIDESSFPKQGGLFDWRGPAMDRPTGQSGQLSGRGVRRADRRPTSHADRYAALSAEKPGSTIRPDATSRAFRRPRVN